jgi:hypothetical protein
VALHERIAVASDAAARTSAALTTRAGVLAALAQRRRDVAGLNQALVVKNGEVERLHRRGTEVVTETAR